MQPSATAFLWKKEKKMQLSDMGEYNWRHIFGFQF